MMQLARKGDTMNIEEAFAKVKLNNSKSKACVETLNFLMGKYGWGVTVLAYLTGEDPTTHEYYCTDEVFEAYVEALENQKFETNNNSKQEEPTLER